MQHCLLGVYTLSEPLLPHKQYRNQHLPVLLLLHSGAAVLEAGAAFPEDLSASSQSTQGPGTGLPQQPRNPLVLCWLATRVMAALHPVPQSQGCKVSSPDIDL